MGSSAVLLPRLFGPVLWRSGVTVKCQCLICDTGWTKFFYPHSFLSFFCLFFCLFFLSFFFKEKKSEMEISTYSFGLCMRGRVLSCNYLI